MGLLNLFSRSHAAAAQSLIPSGSFTVDDSGHIISTTLPRNTPEALLQQIAQAVLSTFSTVPQEQLQVAEFTVTFNSLKITARAIRGGAMIFLAPRTHNPR